MTETVDPETGEIVTQPSVSLARHVSEPTPYSSAETGRIAEALAAAQGEMEFPKRTKPGKIEGTSKATGKAYSFQYMYAPFEEVARVIKAVFPKHGLMYHQGLVMLGEREQFFIRTYVRHVSGEWIAGDYPVMADRAGPQGFAGATTYSKRYGLSLIGGIAAEDDDDGAAAQEAAPEQRPVSDTQMRIRRETAAAPQLTPAREAAMRIRREIANAACIEELDALGVHGVAGMHDRDLIERAQGGDRVWADLVSRDQKRRNELAPPPRQDTQLPDPPLGGEAPFERDYRI